MGVSNLFPNSLLSHLSEAMEAMKNFVLLVILWWDGINYVNGCAIGLSSKLILCNVLN